MNDFLKDPVFSEVSKQYSVAIDDSLHAKCLENPSLAAQFFPAKEELFREEYELDDPIGDSAHSPLAGVIHRYPDRVLLLPVSDCPSYCRFCFRKKFVGKSQKLSTLQLQSAIDYIKADSQIREVILSGGEPLLLATEKLSDLLFELEKIESIDSLRIHTRLPITAPALSESKSFQFFEKLSKPLYMVIHVNHESEVDDDFIQFSKKMRRYGVILLSQTVLLRRVNSSTEDLENLFRMLLSIGVKPYYLHHLDQAPGTSHFRISLQGGRELMQSLRGKLSGLALPTYIFDLPGGEGKVPAEADWLIAKKIDLLL